MPDDPDAVRRFVEDLCVPYQHALATVVKGHDVADFVGEWSTRARPRRGQV